ncbi:putative membrane protein [Marmoricola sp. URHA0025 HA25]
MRFEASTDVAAPAQTVFATYSDVERWPSWTSSVTSVELLDPAPLRVGSRARIRQPKLPEAVWQVTRLEPGREFAWQVLGPGVLTTGTHRVTDNGDGTARVTAILEQRGPIGMVVGLLTRRSPGATCA